MKFTDKKIAQIPKPVKLTQKVDDRVRNLYLRVTPRGTKTFVSRIWVRGKWSTKTLGRFPDISLEEARHMAISEYQEVSAKKFSGNKIAVKDAFKTWFEVMQARNVSESYLDSLQVINNQFFSRLHDTNIDEITKNDVQLLHAFVFNRDKVLDPSRPGNNPRRANEVVTRLSQMLKHFDVDTRVTDIVRSKELARRRALDQEELIAVLRAIELRRDAEQKTVFDMLLLALYTGARKANLVNATWDQFNFKTRTWTIPASQFKSRREHKVYLSDPVIKMIGELEKDSHLLFPSESDPLCPWTNIRKPLLRVAKSAKVNKENFNLKMFRHTFASHAIAAEVPGVIVSQMLGHSSAHSGLQGGAADVTMRVYTHAIAEPVREGFVKYANYIDALVKEVS